MARSESATPGLRAVGGESGAKRAVVVIHGIRQTGDAVAPFACMLAEAIGENTEVYIYGYDYNLSLRESGHKLVEALSAALAARTRIDLVGYSMGGLVARLAATEEHELRLHTVVTLATPNLGALSNAQLAMVGQVGLSLLHIISPLLPRAQGILDLTRAAQIMEERADEMRETDRQPNARRYASIPALWYNDKRADFQFGPSIALTSLQLTLFGANRWKKMTNLTRSHDGNRD